MQISSDLLQITNGNELPGYGCSVLAVSSTFPSGCKPNESFNADANIGHRFAILMANVGALRASRSGAG
jgi:hypothetical protein